MMRRVVLHALLTLSLALPAATPPTLAQPAGVSGVRTLDAFEDVWGTPPDHIDGHQHVHVLPGVREAVVEELLRRYPLGRVWVRDCRESVARSVARRVALPKALLIGALGARLRRLLRASGLPANDGFAGLHDFSGRVPFRRLMQAFLDRKKSREA